MRPLEQRAAAIAEARRVLEASARHQMAFEFTADGWRMVPESTVTAALAVAPMADELRAVS